MISTGVPDPLESKAWADQKSLYQSVPGPLNYGKQRPLGLCLEVSEHYSSGLGSRYQSFIKFESVASHPTLFQTSAPGAPRNLALEGVIHEVIARARVRPS